MAALTFASAVTTKASEATGEEKRKAAKFTKLTVTTGSVSDTLDMPMGIQVVDWAIKNTTTGAFDPFYVSFSRSASTYGRFTITSAAGGDDVELWIWHI